MDGVARRTCRRSSSASRASSSTRARGGSTSFSLQLSGESTERLAEISRDVAHRLSSVPGLEAVRSEAGTGEQEVQVVVNRDRAVAARPHDAGDRADGGRRDARRPPAGAAHLGPRAHDAARVPRVRPPVGRGPGARAGHAAGRLAHRARRGGRLRGAAERPRDPAPQPPDHRRRSTPTSPRARRWTRRASASSRSWTPTRCRRATPGSSAAASRRTTRPCRPWRRTCCSPSC